MKSLFVLLLLCSIASFSLVACGSTPASAQTGNEVHLDTIQFVQSSITLHKGASLTLINDSSNSHIIANGLWENGTAQTVQEPSAPQVNAMQLTGNSTVSIGPFTTAGTFHLYCTIHQNMNLTVVVQ
jgi:plastocyanin